MFVQLEEQWSFLPFGEIASFLYLRGGLTEPATITLLIAAPLATIAWANRQRLLQRMERRDRPDIEDLDETTTTVAGRRLTPSQIATWAVIGLLLVFAPQLLGVRLSEVIGTVGLFVLLGLGLNIVVGYAGLLDLGYVAFFAVGSYVTAVLTSAASPAFSPELNFWAALPFVMVAAAIIGLMIGFPVLRLRGDYLAIVTLGLGEIARILFLSDWLAPWVGGAQGILQIPPPQPVGRDPQELYYPIVLFCILAALAAWSFANSRVGRAWNAMREDEEVAEATGINTTNYKLLAFATGAAFGCIGGAFFAVKIGSVFPHSFDIEVSINALAIVILGGIGSIPGVILGAAVLVGLPELLREFAEFRLLIYGALLVAMMILRPEGLIPNRQRKAELHEQEDVEDQYDSDAGDETGEPVITTGGAA
jgi:branched-chain amino acid transport system permease protein